MRYRIIAMLVFAWLLTTMGFAQQRNEDTEELGKAIEYFQSGKYHEALLIFQRLDRLYRLNDRFRAYIGLCYYHEWEYDKAVEYLESSLPQLSGLSPHELSVYYYANAESHFNLNQYEEAIVYYEQVLTVCYDREKGDAYYKLGFCYMFKEQWANARDNYRAAEAYYRKFRNNEDLEARLQQLNRMILGCESKMDENDIYEEPIVEGTPDEPAKKLEELKNTNHSDPLPQMTEAPNPSPTE